MDVNNPRPEEVADMSRDKNLKTCPFCGGKVVIAVTEYRGTRNFFITRAFSENGCTCRVFMESEQYNVDDDQEHVDKVKCELVKAWNRRANEK